MSRQQSEAGDSQPASAPPTGPQERMGHLDAQTTQIYADYMPGAREAEPLDAALGVTDANLDSNFRHGVYH